MTTFFEMLWSPGALRFAGLWGLVLFVGQYVLQVTDWEGDGGAEARRLDRPFFVRAVGATAFAWIMYSLITAAFVR